MGKRHPLDLNGVKLEFDDPDEYAWNAVEFKGELHVVPIEDRRKHRLFDCWCKPKYEREGLALSPVWIHNSADRREAEE